jgi:enoyl-CoA hydratase/carnithine racemase
MSEASVRLERRGETAVMVLNRPDKLNAFNESMWARVAVLCAEVADDRALKVLVVRGATPKAFSAGADIAEFPKVHAKPETAEAYHQTIREAYEALAALPKPTIALVQGVCYGGGCAFALCCDLRYADATARFCIPPAKLGIGYSLLETRHLVDVVGPSKAMEMLMGAREIAAEEALATGLVTRLFPTEMLEDETFAFAERLCGLSQYTIRTVKQVVQAILKGQTDDDPATEALVAEGFDGADYREGRDAFLEKRKPHFTFR